jgi:limonene-1,2-epoxide hydrolase
MLYQVGCLVGQAVEAVRQIELIQAHLKCIQTMASSFKVRPKVYFEEWDSPQISAIRLVSELLGLAGGDDVFPELAQQSLGKDRIIADGAQVLARDPRTRQVRYVPECEGEFWSLGPHDKSRRRIICWRVPRDNVHYDPDHPQILKIPFLAFADEEIADRDDVLLPIVHEIMMDAAKKQGVLK